jgi:phosphodiesterase/alkaline phosphatase D-like protein
VSAAPLPDVTAPNILSTLVLPVETTSATVSLMTNEPGFSEVEYGTTTAYNAVSARDASATVSHTITLSGLVPNTLYYYRIRTTDRAGNVSVSTGGTFTTRRSTNAPPPPPTGVRLIG